MKIGRITAYALVVIIFVLFFSLVTPVSSKTVATITLPGVCNAKLAPLAISWQLPADVEGELKQKNFNVVQRAVDTFAWQEFIALNWPAIGGDGDRGVPDKNLAINAPGPRVWETWKETNEVYLPNGAVPQPWNSNEPLPNGLQGDGRTKILFRQSKVDEVLNDEFQPTKADGALPGTLTDQWGNVVRYEIRMNKVLFDYVVQNKFYNPEQQALLPEINAPDGSILIKAAWREITPEESGRFHNVPAYVQDLTTGKYQLQQMGLVGFHIMYKTPSAPQWIWSTYEQVDNVPGLNHSGSANTVFSFHGDRCVNCLTNQQTILGIPNQVTRRTAIPHQDPDCSQPTKAVHNVAKLNRLVQAGLKDSVWANYELINAQWAIPKSAADKSPDTVFHVLPALLANTTMETYIQETSSCMGCHAMARSSNGKKFASADFSFTFADALPTQIDPQVVSPPDEPVTAWDNQHWNSILRGYQLTTETYEEMPEFVPTAKLHCASCHLNAGANPKASSWFGMMKKYQYPETINLQKRINLCFEHSLNGKPLPITADSPDFQAFITYMQWLDKQAQVLNIDLPKTPYPPITKLTGNPNQGQAIFEQKCAFCHGALGQGRYGSDTYYRPALWGPNSFNRQAGMARINTLAEFIHGNMPYQFDGVLTDQEAWDLATYIDGQPRPEGPGSPQN
ncbi:c-type cytochrome [Synechocystis sp. CACIAM 05]|uniref:c-type cytochrome n=1 Tax=Synechocystis sp. CACIAM 05 TaxID=1933929 RepID=UPI00138E7E57|nr:c-type cytochrome [Synechocystis sp. CACIAM 05]QHU99560.1 cytochrome c [Synechocystis sp. CACIAM 05]